MNQLSHGQKINIPTSTIRSVSFQKVRQGSLSSRTPITQQNQKSQKVPQNSGLCQRLISKKLLANQNQQQRKPFEQKEIKSNINQKAAMLKKHLQEKQMKQCTFKPKVNRSNAPQRTLGEFIDHQRAYEKQKEDKVTQMRQIIKAKIDKQNTFQPNIVVASKNQQQKRNNLQVHQRLYDQFTKRKQSKQNSIPQSIQKRNNSKFTTQRKINTFSRKGSQKSIVQSCLASKKHILTHNDLSDFNSSIPNASESSKQNTQINQHDQCVTTRRQNSRTNSVRSSKSQKRLKVTKYMDVQEVCQKKLYLKNKLFQDKQREPKKISHKNKQLYVQKVLRQISSVLSQLGINKNDLNYMQMSIILQKMNFFDEQTNINDRKYLFQIWQMLQGDIYESCPLTNLIKIIFCLLGCHDFNIVEECLSQFMCETSSAKRLVLSQKQSKNIKSNFEQLYLNRLKKGEFVAHQPRPQTFSFKPFISKNSAQMAQKYRQRVIQQSQQLLNKNLIQFDINQNGQVDHIDLLLLDDKRKQLKMKIKRQQQERQKKRLQDEAMQGQRLRRQKVKGQQKYYESQQAINSRFQHLYQLGKQHIRAKNQKPEYFEYISKECTFQPNVNKSKQNSNKAQSKQYSQYNTNSLQASNRVGEDIRDFDKSIFRMYEGRRIRQQSSQASRSVTDRSLISQQQQKSRDEDDSPFLYLNVNMEGKDDIKVPVFHGDSMKTITHKVKLLMGLDQAQDSKLQQILKLQILPTLRQIGMNIDFQ